jgi:hypothetical protein
VIYGHEQGLLIYKDLGGCDSINKFPRNFSVLNMKMPKCQTLLRNSSINFDFTEFMFNLISKCNLVCSWL